MIIKLLHNMKIGNTGGDAEVIPKGTVLNSKKETIHPNILMDVRDVPHRFEIIELEDGELDVAPASSESLMAQTMAPKRPQEAGEAHVREGADEAMALEMQEMKDQMATLMAQNAALLEKLNAAPAEAAPAPAEEAPLGADEEEVQEEDPEHPGETKAVRRRRSV